MPLEEMTPGVARLRTLIANIYFVGTPGGPWVLVDTGTPGNAARIRDAAEERFGREARPSAILLTHGHWDHAGSALELAEYWDVDIYAHRLERPFLTGKAKYPPKDPMAGGACSFMSRFFPASTLNLGERLRDLPEGGEVPGLVGWRWHFTPGHAPGHVAFFQRYESVLLAGDACATMDLDSALGILAQEPRISRPPAPFTYDWDQAQRSIEWLADLRPLVIGAGHGEPMSGSAVAIGLADLARDFPRPRGRYALEPARVDPTGVAFLPPPAPDPAPKIAVGVGIAAVALGALLVLSRRKVGQASRPVRMAPRATQD
ncbi:MAG: MBL fold metallo-hydrolase [Bryobacteraceae bacterium]